MDINIQYIKYLYLYVSDTENFKKCLFDKRGEQNIQAIKIAK